MTRWNTLGKQRGMGGGPEIRGDVWVSGSGRLFNGAYQAGTLLFQCREAKDKPRTCFQPHKGRLEDGSNMPSFIRHGLTDVKSMSL